MADESPLPLYEVSRRVLLQDDLNEISKYSRKDEKLCVQLKRYIKTIRYGSYSCMLGLIPVIKWLPKYSFKSNILGDLFAGVTLAVMQIPQGMGFALLAGVSPSVGLYMAFIHSLVYFLFGTSRHISVGTSSVVSVMCLEFVNEYGTSHKTSSGVIVEALYSPYQVVTALSFACGLQLLLMAVFQLGSVVSLLSECLISGFITGAAVHVLTNQIKDLLGIRIVSSTGVSKVGKTLYSVGSQIKHTNLTTLIISVIVIVFLLIVNDWFKPRLAKICRFPFPVELLVVVCGTLASWLINLESKHGVHLVGTIPLGLPVPQLPSIDLLRKVAIGAIPISIVSYTISISITLTIAAKKNYDVRPNQELVALAACNLIGGFFTCIPIGSSIIRSLVQEHTGGNTQVVSVISAGLILLVVLWIGALFESLPRCILAGIIVVTLKEVFMKIRVVKRFHEESIFNSMTWVITFLAVVLIDVDIGLFVGIGISVITLYIKGWRSWNCELGNVPATNLYVDIATHGQALTIPNIRIYRHNGPINFVFGNSFKTSLYRAMGITSKAIREATKTVTDVTTTAVEPAEPRKSFGFRCLIIDLSGVSHVDVAGVKCIWTIHNEIKRLGVQLILSGPNDHVYDIFSNADRDFGIHNLIVLASVHDAVLFGRSLL